MPQQENNENRASDISFTVRVNGTEIPRSHNVVSVVVYHGVNRIPFAKILMLDGAAASGDFPISNLPDFEPGNEIEIEAGFGGEEDLIFKGIVVKHAIQLKENNTSLLSVDAKHPAVKMTKHRQSKIFTEQTDADIASAIADTYGISMDADTTSVTHAEMVQYNSTDWDMIVARAEANGLLVICEPGNLLIKKPALSEASVLDLQYGTNLKALEVGMDARSVYEDADVLGWSYADQEMLTGEGSPPSGWTEPGNISVGDMAGKAGTAKKIITTPLAMDEGELRELASGNLLKQQLSKIRGSATCKGNAVLKPGVMIDLKNVGDRFSGKQFVSAVRHEINQGSWFSNVQWGLDPDAFINEYPVNDTPAQAILPAVHGLQIGIVTQLESDPLGEDRILVKLPAVDAASDGVWARQALADAGNERGTFFRPEIGDEVIVGFLNDDPRYPVVLGMLNSSAKPAVMPSTDDNHEKGIVTREKLKIWFNDDTKVLEISTPGGKVILLDEDAGELTIKDENDNMILLSSDGITISSGKDLILKATGNISMEGVEIAGSASGSLKMEGSGSAELSSSGTATLKGSLVIVN